MGPTRVRRAVGALAAGLLLLSCGSGGGARSPAPTWTVSGSVSGAPSPVTLTISGDASATAVTDDTGAYRFDGLADGDYTVTPALEGWVFTPASLPVSVGGASVPANDFTATPAPTTFTISGVVRGAGAGVTVELSSNGASTWTTTDESGAFAFRDRPNGFYSLRAMVAGAIVTPPGRTVRIKGAHSASLDFALSPQLCNASGWCWENPMPQGKDLRAVWGSSANDVWMVGSAGTILRWNGSAWSLLPAGSTNQLNAVWGTSASDVWIAGAAGTLLHWNGTALTPVASGTSVELLGLGGTSAADAWAVGSSGKILHWNGTAWSSAPTGLYSVLRAVWASSAADAWAVGDDGVVLRWNGTSWVSVATGITESLESVWGSSATDVWAVGSQGSTLHWDGAQGTLTTGASDGDACVWGTSASHVWRVFSSSIEHWTGTAWSLTNGPGFVIQAMWGSGPSDVWGVGDRGAVAHWDGLAWTGWPRFYTRGPGGGLWGTSATDLWTGARGLHRDERGWSATGQSGDAVWGTSPTDVWAVGYRNAYHWDGSAWSAVPVGDTAWFSAVWAASPNDAWGGGPYFLGHWDGTAWTPALGDLSYSSYPWINGIWGRASDDVWAVGDQSAVLHWDGTAWTTVSTGVAGDYQSVWGAPGSQVWLATSYGVVRWDGTAWQSMSSGLAGSGRLTRIWGRSDADVWVVGWPGLIRHWNGTAWEVEASPTSDSLEGIWGTDDEVWTVSVNGVILRRDH